MAKRAEKDKFFAQLDRLDESSENEAQSENDNNIERKVAHSTPRKRQKFDRDIGISHPEPLQDRPTSSNHGASLKGSSSPKKVHISRQGVPQEPSREANATEDLPAQDIRTESSRKNRSKSKGNRGTGILNKSAVKTGLFEGLSFYFVPNDDVSKPRKLRIQSAISQGATWVRKISPGITHVIVDPEIQAPAIIKLFKDWPNIPLPALVKVNWLIESLSHRDVRDTTHSRFQLKGSSALIPPAHEGSEVFSSSGSGFNPQKRENERLNGSDRLNATTDELRQIVDDVRAATYLPFDDEIDLDSLISFSSGDEKAEETREKGKIIPMAGEENRGFRCMESSAEAKGPNPNDRTISILQQMTTYYNRTGDHWRALAYRKAINALRKQSELINTSQKARTINGIGARIADKIEEIATTDRLRRLDVALSEPDDKILQLFTGIYGVGLRQARLWIGQGYRTLDDLIKHATLTANQKIGVERYEDFAKRIPREEVGEHGNIVAQALKIADVQLQAIVGGSYRRGLPDSGDIDVLITHPTATISRLRAWVFDLVVPHLFGIGFMKCTLASSHAPKLPPPCNNDQGQEICCSCDRRQSSPQNSSNGRISRANTNAWCSCGRRPQDLFPSPSASSGTKFHGASSLPSSQIWRRIDLLLVPPTSLGASLIYFTGNDIFNRSLRLLARKKGMRLNQHGLYKDVLRSGGGAGEGRVTDGELVEGRSEKRIFEILGVPYREPAERNC